MKNIYITEIEIKKVRHLNKIKINLSDTECKHLIFTGKNGSGKTSVLNEIAENLKNRTQIWRAVTHIKKENDSKSEALKRMIKYYRKIVNDYQKISEIEIDTAINKTEEEFLKNSEGLNSDWILQMSKDKLDIAVKLSLNDTWKSLYNEYDNGRFLLAYYKCDRVYQASVSEHIEKIELNNAYSLEETPGDLFVKYLVDLKVTEALTRNGTNQEKANAIHEWFINFEKLLRQIFEDPSLELSFDEETFGFMICQEGREPYNFNCMSSGFSAIMDIVLDLMIRMVKKKGRIFEFDLPGIVLIDEIETHLHLELQKKIMSIFTKLFPNIQFIVSTHSPFVLNSIDNVVIYDLENHITVKNGLTDVPYEGIVEGYFQVDTLSDILKEKFEEYKALTQKTILTDEDFEEIARLEMFLDEIPDYLALNITTEYQRLKAELAEREDI